MKKTLILMVALVLGAAGSATASEEGSAQRGAAKAFYCTGCHGYNGMGGSAAVPVLAGKDEAYLAEKLMGFKKKKSSIMGLQLAKFKDGDLKDLAAYFSSLKATGHGEASFERDIQPIIKWRCISCHTTGGEGETKSGLSLASYKDLMAGTDQGGDLIVPGSSATSSFMVMVTRKDHLRMPFGAPPLADDEIRVIRSWIDQGAKNN